MGQTKIIKADLDRVVEAVHQEFYGVSATKDPIWADRIRTALEQFVVEGDEKDKLLERASWLVGNPGTNISGSTDVACDNWQRDYKKYIESTTPNQEGGKG